jgi:D-Tyr-tRNAtyr deacylase
MLTYEEKRELLLRVYFNKYDTLELTRKQTAHTLNISTSTLDRWAQKGVGPVFHQDEHCKNATKSYSIIDVIDFLAARQRVCTISQE